MEIVVVASAALVSVVPIIFSVVLSDNIKRYQMLYLLWYLKNLLCIFSRTMCVREDSVWFFPSLSKQEVQHYITSHQTNLLNDVHKVLLAVFTCHKLRFGICLSIPLIHLSAADLVLYWHWNYLPERTSCNFWNNKNSQDARYCSCIVYGSSKTLCRRR